MGAGSVGFPDLSTLTLNLATPSRLTKSMGNLTPSENQEVPDLVTDRSSDSKSGSEKPIVAAPKKKSGGRRKKSIRSGRGKKCKKGKQKLSTAKSVVQPRWK